MTTKHAKKNCHNCKFGYWDSGWDELSYTSHDYFVCEKRDSCGDDVKLTQNLEKASYLEKAKRCCELITNKPRVSKH